MNALTTEFSSSGFRVLGFPCNNFYLQEPGANYSEILNGIKYVRPGGGFVPNFQMFKKIDVNGKDEHQLYTYLKSMCGPTSDAFEDDSFLFYEPKHVSDVRWNFEVFLIYKNGLPLYRYSPDTEISDIEFDIRELLKGEYAYYYCLGLLLCVVVGYAGMDCKIGRVRSRISNCNIDLSVNDLPSFSGHEDLTSFCKHLECTIKCYIDAIGDCYKEDACFMYNPGVYKVTSRAICSNPNETSLALVACQWKDNSCLKTFQKAVDGTQLNTNGDNVEYKTSYCNALVDLTSCVDFAIRDSCTDKLANIMNDIYKASLSYTACGIEEHPYFSTYEGDVTCRGNSVHWTVNTFISTLIILAVECSIWNQNCLNT